MITRYKTKWMLAKKFIAFYVQILVIDYDMIFWLWSQKCYIVFSGFVTFTIWKITSIWNFSFMIFLHDYYALIISKNTSILSVFSWVIFHASKLKLNLLCKIFLIVWFSSTIHAHIHAKLLINLRFVLDMADVIICCWTYLFSFFVL